MTGPASSSDHLAVFNWLRALYELGQAAATGAEPLGVQQAILEHIVAGFDAASGSIALRVDGTDDILEIVAGTDLPPGVLGSRLPPGVGVYGHIMATGQPLLINGDVAETHLPLRQRDRGDRRTHSAMCWPLRVRDRIIGAVAVNRAPGTERYSVNDLSRGQAVTSLLALVIANHRMHVEREARIVELSTLNATMQRMNALLAEAQDQIIQSEKLASIGQLAAGVAHEINNPAAYVLSNIGSLQSYLGTLLELLDLYVEAERDWPLPVPDKLLHARAKREQVDLDFIRRDVSDLLAESRDGMLRVTQITQDVKGYSRSAANEVWEPADVREMLERTLNIAHNEIKHKARIETHYGDMPPIECVASRLEQVFLNLVVNAAQAIRSSGTITVAMGTSAGEAWVSVEDTGCGIPEANLKRLFEPFFTTKPVGQGTGLGLSVSDSIVRRHGGRIEVETEVGRGSRFTVRLPLRQLRASTEKAERDSEQSDGTFAAA